MSVSHELEGKNSTPTAADTSSIDGQHAHTLDVSVLSVRHENDLDQLEDIYLTSPTVVISSDVTLPPSPSPPSKVSSVAPPLKPTKLEFKLVSSFGNDPDTVPSQKGGAKLVFQGAYFNKDGQNKSKLTSYYRCDQNALTNCKSHVIVTWRQKK